jgi:hypothetical protein
MVSKYTLPPFSIRHIAIFSTSKLDDAQCTMFGNEIALLLNQGNSRGKKNNCFSLRRFQRRDPFQQQNTDVCLATSSLQRSNYVFLPRLLKHLFLITPWTETSYDIAGADIVGSHDKNTNTVMKDVSDSFRRDINKQTSLSNIVIDSQQMTGDPEKCRKRK